jgi:hypothetical protein
MAQLFRPDRVPSSTLGSLLHLEMVKRTLNNGTFKDV